MQLLDLINKLKKLDGTLFVKIDSGSNPYLGTFSYVNFGTSTNSDGDVILTPATDGMTVSSLITALESITQTGNPTVFRTPNIRVSNVITLNDYGLTQKNHANDVSNTYGTLTEKTPFVLIA